MKTATVKKIAIITLLIGILGAGFHSLWLPKLNQNKPKEIVADGLFGWKFPIAKFPSTGLEDGYLAYSSIRDPGGIPRGLPVRLTIPSIGVDSAIEDALITPDGRMDVPAGTKNVAWFALGPHPGKVGSAVIGGHFGIYQDNKGPAVFNRLNQLKVGSLVNIIDDNGDTLSFIVRSTKSFDRNDDTTTVFTSQDGLAHLNLITCEGIWNQVDGNYPQRLVVFTEAISKESAAAVVTKAPTKPPTPIASPQPTVSPLPTLEPVVEQKESPVITPLLEKEEDSPATSSGIFASAKSLYETPVDGAITSSLLVSIMLMLFKIVR